MVTELFLLAALAAPQQTPGVTPVPGPVRTAVVAVDTPDARPVAIEHSDAYYMRLTIHRYASWAMLPVFVGQYLAGRQLIDKSSDAPGWARVGHRVLATTTLGLFGVNTVTGGINFWQSRGDSEGKTRRTLHSISMLVADAGFVAVGLLAEPAERKGNIRTLHKHVALGSMGLATVSWMIMLPIFDHD